MSGLTQNIRKYLTDPVRRSINRRLVSLNYPPPIIMIEPTNNCNLECIICPLKDSKRKTGFMDMRLYEKIISQINYKPSFIGLFVFGEPLLHPEIVRMTGLCTDKSFYSYIHTNATVLTRSFAFELINVGLNHISFSFEGENKTTYERIRCGANYEKTLNNIIEFLAVKKELNVLKPVVTIQVIKLYEGKNRLPPISKSFRKLFQKLPVNDFRCIPARDWSGAIRESFIYPSPKRKYSTCRALYEMFVVLWDGKAVPCCGDVDGNIVLGDTNKDTIRTIWNNRCYVNLRKCIIEENLHGLNPCLSCGSRPPFIGSGIKGIVDLLRYRIYF